MTNKEAKSIFFNKCCGECDSCPNYNPHDIYNSGCDLVDELFEKLGERPQGKWILNDIQYGSTSYRCSVCNDVTDDVPTCMNKPLYKYCPVCGAEMEVGTHDPN